MNETTERFLGILKAALAGEAPEIPRDIPVGQWHELFRMAQLHNVLPLFYDTVYALPSLTGEQSLLAAVKHRARQQVIVQTMRTAEFLELYRRLESAGVRALVVKGITCRILYPRPDYRPSGDEDVLIDPESFEICHRILTEFGMETTAGKEKLSAAYEIPYRKPGSPLYIELHKHLFPPESDAYGDMNRFFADVRGRAVAMEIQGQTIRTLDYTDNLFYLICHAFKHFLHSGFGIRQVCDIVLYANTFGSRVDWDRVLENCRSIQAEKFAAALLEIGRKYLGFDPGKAAYPSSWQEIRVNELPMLEDLLSGGLYGDASMSRKHSSNITLDAVAARKRGRKAKNAIVASVFPSAAKLAGRYPYLKERPWLLPAAWCSRLWEYGRETRKTRDSNASDALKIGSERVELMKIYGILE